MQIYDEALSWRTFGDNEVRSRLALSVARAVQGKEEETLPPNLLAYVDAAFAALEQNIAQSNRYHLLYRLQLSDVYNLNLSHTGRESEDIERVVRESIAISPGRMEFEFALAQTEFLKSNYNEAIRILQEASRKNPDHYMPYWKISQNYYFAGDVENAAKYLEKAIYHGLHLRSFREVQWAETYYLETENLEKIIYFDELLLRELTIADPAERVRIHMNLALAYAKLGKKEQAVSHAKEMESIDPSQAPAVSEFLRALDDL